MSHLGSTGWTLVEIGCSCGAQLLRGVSFARTSSKYIMSSTRATAVALTDAYRHSVDGPGEYGHRGASELTYASSEGVRMAMFPSLSREDEKADGLEESTGWSWAARWSELRWKATSETAKVAETDGFPFSAGRPCCACMPGGSRMADSCSTSKRAGEGEWGSRATVKKDGPHEQRAGK